MTRWLLVLLLLATPATVSAQDGDADEGSEGEEGQEGQTGQTGEEPGAEGDADEDADEAPAKGPKGEAPPAATPAPEPAPEPEPEPEPAPQPTVAPEPPPIVPAYAPEPAPSPMDLLMQAPPPPLRIELPHGFWLTPEADVQVWATLVDMDDDARNNPIVVGDPDHREGFSIRRARLGLIAGLGSLARIRVTAGWQDRYDALSVRPTGPQLVEASFRFTPIRYIGFTAGYTRVPFGRQQINGSTDLALFERAMLSQTIAPDREPGVTVGGSLGMTGSALIPDEFLTYEIGVSNGTSDFTGDLDPEPRISGRLQVNLFDDWAGRESRFLEASPAALSVGGGVMYNRALQANTTTVGADLGLQVWRIQVQGEIAWSKAVPTFDIAGIPELLATRTAFGWYGQLVFAVVPERLELAFRVDGYDDNLALDDAGNRLDIAGGVNLLLLKGRLKLQLDYIHREELVDAAKTANDSLVMVLQARL